MNKKNIAITVIISLLLICFSGCREDDAVSADMSFGEEVSQYEDDSNYTIGYY